MSASVPRELSLGGVWAGAVSGTGRVTCVSDRQVFVTSHHEVGITKYSTVDLSRSWKILHTKGTISIPRRAEVGGGHVIFLGKRIPFWSKVMAVARNSASDLNDDWNCRNSGNVGVVRNVGNFTQHTISSSCNSVNLRVRTSRLCMVVDCKCWELQEPQARADLNDGNFRNGRDFGNVRNVENVKNFGNVRTVKKCYSFLEP